MIKIINNEIVGKFPVQYSYCKNLKWIARLILPVTRYLRAVNAEKYITNSVEKILDVGCGDGFFLKRINAKEKYGFDALLGDTFASLNEFPDGYFDCITMLAVIEHFADHEVVFRHLWPLLRPGGLLIITTPKRISEKIVRWYAPEVENDHATYYGRQSLADLLGKGFELQGYHIFEAGLNQVFCFSRRVEILPS